MPSKNSYPSREECAAVGVKIVGPEAEDYGGPLTQSSKRVVVLLSALALVSPCAAADQQTVAEALDQAYKGQRMILRTFYGGSTLHYSSDGVLIKGSRPGAWTLDAFIQVKNVSFKKDRLSIAGNRLNYVYEESGKGLKALMGSDVTVEIDADPSHASISSLQESISKIFISGNERFVDFVPAFWKPFLLHPGATPGELTAGLPVSDKPEIGKKVTPARALYHPNPAYPEWAKSARIRGTVQFVVVIGEDGRIKNLTLLKPLGMGLDDLAAESIQTWKYEPCRVDGKPTMVQATIEATFDIR